jgi:hypothetical protein
MVRTTVVALLAAGALAASATARAESAPVTATAPPWSDPAHVGPLEVFASRLVSSIARRPVTVECDDQATWENLEGDYGVGLEGELGLVDWTSSTDHAVASVDTVAHLAPAVCAPLQAFATASVKPTMCDGGRPCFGARGEREPAEQAYWRRYDAVAEALLTLAHEAVHLGGVVGGIVDGVQVGDPRAEAKAECRGMQWLPWTAEQLGASAADARAIARYSFRVDYPRERGTPYWSAQCVPGGALDIRPAWSQIWP